jgi:hypothetical protein
MSYDYRARIVFVTVLADDRHPAFYDLCAAHSRTLAPPRGWTVQQPQLDTTPQYTKVRDPLREMQAPEIAALVGAKLGGMTTEVAREAPELVSTTGADKPTRSDSKRRELYAAFPPRNRPDAYLRRVV